MAIVLVLNCPQSMHFWIHTAFCVSGNPFYGTAVNPFFGISQGGGLAPPMLQTISTLMINSYKSLGHGVHFVSLVTGTMLHFSATLYVGYMDLLLRADNPETPDCEFFQKIQRALSTWA